MRGSKFHKLTSVLTASCACLLAHPASAKKIEADTPLLVIGSEDKISAKTVKTGDVIVSSRVVYALLAVANEDIHGSDGKVVGARSDRLLLAKGEQLFGIVAKNGQTTYCAVKHKPTGALEGIFVINSDKHTCFIDRDNDGRFDESYDLRTKFSSTPIYYDVEVTGNPLSEPVAYSRINPLELKLPIVVEILLSRLKNRGTVATLSKRIRSEENVDYLQDSENVLLDKARNITVFGANFDIFSGKEKGIVVELKKGIESFELTTLRPNVFYNFIFI